VPLRAAATTILLVAGFAFDGSAQTAIEEADHPHVRIHMAHIRPDVNPAMDGLLKETPGSQLFSVFGRPRTALKGPAKDGTYTVTMEGVDIYDPVTNTIDENRADKVAAWFVDSDYDGRTFCITQAFFPDKSAWEKLAKALRGAVDENAFAAPRNRVVAVSGGQAQGHCGQGDRSARERSDARAPAELRGVPCRRKFLSSRSKTRSSAIRGTNPARIGCMTPRLARRRSSNIGGRRAIGTRPSAPARRSSHCWRRKNATISRSSMPCAMMCDDGAKPDIAAQAM
jgi:hypothetical protein